MSIELYRKVLRSLYFAVPFCAFNFLSQWLLLFRNYSEAKHSAFTWFKMQNMP